MLTDHDSDWNIDDITDAEIYVAIRYLEPAPRNPNRQDTDDDDKDYGVVICVCLYIALFVGLVCLWFYCR